MNYPLDKDIVVKPEKDRKTEQKLLENLKTAVTVANQKNSYTPVRRLSRLSAESAVQKNNILFAPGGALDDASTESQWDSNIYDDPTLRYVPGTSSSSSDTSKDKKEPIYIKSSRSPSPINILTSTRPTTPPTTSNSSITIAQETIRSPLTTSKRTRSYAVAASSLVGLLKSEIEEGLESGNYERVGPLTHIVNELIDMM